jgi:putative membrane protein
MDVGVVALVFLVNIVLLFAAVAVVVVFIRWLIRNSNTPRVGGPLASSGWPAAKPEDTALALLRERFARGEIDADEFEQRRRTLGS